MSDFLTILNPFTGKLQKVFVGAGSGDMTKIVYDTNDNGIPDKAENVDDGAGNATTASDVKLSNTHRSSNGTDHANVVLNDTHRGSDGKNHADVLLNNTHRAIATGNPHSVSKAELSLSNVTDDAQLKRSAGDINSFAEKGTPINADLIIIEDSADSNTKKKIQIGNLPGAGGTDADAIHDNVSGEIILITEKASPVSGDVVIIEDSADSNNKKRVQLGNLPAGSGTDNDAIHDNVAGEISIITEKVTPINGDFVIIEDSADSNNKKRVQVGNLPSPSAPVDSVNGETGVVVLDEDDIGVGVTNKKYTDTEKTKLAGIDTGAEVNVATDLSEGSSTETTVDVNSSDGANATLVSASATRAGLLTKAKFDEIVVNNAKVSYDDASAVGLNTTHRSSDGTNHANVVLNDTHRGVTTGNPHSVTKANVGLTNVPDLNTTDAVTNEHTHANIAILDGDQESFTTVLKDKLDAIVNPMLFKGEINIASDFPTAASVQNGWTFRIASDVTDNDGTKTNTGQSFLSDAEIAWNGTDWTELGYSAVKSVNGATGIVTLDTTDINFNVIGSPTYKTTQELFDKIQSSGIIDGGLISDAGTGTINVSAVKGVIKTTNSGIGENVNFDLSSASGLALTDNSINHVLVDYNAGSPQFVVSISNTSNGNTIFLVGEIYREGTELSIIQSGINIQNIASRLQEQHIEESIDIHFASGAVVSEAGTRNIAITSGIMYAGLNRILTNAINTTGADDFEYYYYNGSIWIESNQSQIDNTQYNDIASGLSTLSNNKYGVHWVYKSVNSTTFVLYGQGDYTLSEAQSAQQPASLPDHVLHIGVLRAKIIILKSASSFLEIENSADDVFNASTPANHNELGNLQGGQATEYFHLTNTKHTEATRDATNTQNGLMPSGLKTGYDNAVTHIGADGTSHANVALNDTHRGSNGTNHANVVLNDTHRGSDGTDHANVVTNDAKETNVSTNLSEGTSTETTVDVNSSDGNNATLVSASATRAGLLTKAKFDEIVVNTAKVDTALSSITFIIDGGGSAITTGIKGDLEIPFDCTITEVTMLADQSGSIVVDVWKDTYALFPATDADSITASAVPTITTAVKSQDGTLTGWTTSISAGDILRFNVDSITTIERLTITLKVTRT